METHRVSCTRKCQTHPKVPDAPEGARCTRKCQMETHRVSCRRTRKCQMHPKVPDALESARCTRKCQMETHRVSCRRTRKCQMHPKVPDAPEGARCTRKCQMHSKVPDALESARCTRKCQIKTDWYQFQNRWKPTGFPRSGVGVPTLRGKCGSAASRPQQSQNAPELLKGKSLTQILEAEVLVRISRIKARTNVGAEGEEAALRVV
uniref:Uncharacterized protein n=1 Tax=Molossus molossus TaxID=27622 RepID=A0A7J8I1E1_MOLMO|nr:hypothetical protein HJG59_010887 [Molossus molossus]